MKRFEIRGRNLVGSHSQYISSFFGFMVGKCERPIITHNIMRHVITGRQLLSASQVRFPFHCFIARWHNSHSARLPSSAPSRLRTRRVWRSIRLLRIYSVNCGFVHYGGRYARFTTFRVRIFICGPIGRKWMSYYLKTTRTISFKLPEIVAYINAAL